VKLEAAKSSLEDWQKEARKLELQGKQEQADAIRRDILRQTPVPWPVLDEAQLRALLAKTFRDKAPGSKHKQQLYEYATCHDEPELARHLLQDVGFGAAGGFAQQRRTHGRKTWLAYFQRNFKDILRQCDQHGADHRLLLDQTPLMAAAAAGNLALVDALLERGASLEATDHHGWNALHWALREAFRDPAYARGPFAAIFDRVAPSSVDLNTGERLVRIDRHHTEYLLLQTMWTLFRSRFNERQRRPWAAFETQAILDAWQPLPAAVLRPERNKRQHLSNVLSRNEVARDYAYNRQLFVRVEQGWYQFNPALSVRRRSAAGDGEAESWVPIYQVLNLPLIAEFARFETLPALERYLDAAGLSPCPIPMLNAEMIAREQETLRRLEEARRQREEAERRLAAKRRQPAAKPAPPRWGTPQAKAREIERIRAEIAARHAAEKNGKPDAKE
jgi:hypothetical protein